MKQRKQKEKQLVIEDWVLIAERPEKGLIGIIPKIKGFVDGKEIDTATVYWLDTEEGIAMTEKNIYKLGEPNKHFLNIVYSNGGTLSDLDLKGTMH